MSTSLTTTQGDSHARNQRLADLLAHCHNGSESAFEELYRLSSAQLYGVLLRILRIEAIAEEALQDSYVKIWQKAGTYSPDAGSPMAWMYSIARHQALDELRRRGSREDQENRAQPGVIESTPDRTKPLHEMGEDAQLIMLCLNRLPEQARLCIVRAYCEGFSHEELSQQVDSPTSTIKSWIRRGLISLRKCLDELD